MPSSNIAIREKINEIVIGEYIFSTESIYSEKFEKEAERVFYELVSDGKARGVYSGVLWEMYDGMAWTKMIWKVNPENYRNHGAKCFHYTLEKFIRILKAFFMLYYGDYINNSVAHIKAQAVVTFAENYGKKGYTASDEERYAIKLFLLFISVDTNTIDKILQTIGLSKEGSHNTNRTLKRPINYLTIVDAVRELYSNDIDNETFVKWFPIWFWVNITFVLPTRPTEMLVTPFACIYNDGKRQKLLMRKTLKKKGRRIVYNEIEMDYTTIPWDIPVQDIVDTIEKYIDLTKDLERRFLFKHSNYSLNKYYSLPQFNQLLKDFMDEYIISNAKYLFVKKALNIDKFEYVTAGDSRSIAIANIYYCSGDLDICRQLAGQERIDITNGYYLKGAEMIEDTSVMDYINDIYKTQKVYAEKMEKRFSLSKASGLGCELENPDYLIDCDGKEEDCMECDHYRYTEEELNEYYKKTKDDFEKVTYDLMFYLQHEKEAVKAKINLDELIMKQTKCRAKFKIAIDKKNGEMYARWERDNII